MNIMLILFTISLLAIITMIARKLVQLRKSAEMVLSEEEVLFEIPYIDEVTVLTTKNIRRYGYMSLATAIRLYFRSSALVKNTYNETKTRAKEVIERNKKLIMKSELGNREISGFLKTISEYKAKIDKLKHKIREEEKKM